MSAEQEHQVLVDGRGGAVARLGPHAVARHFLLDFAPGVRDEVEAKEIVFVLAVVATKNVHAFLVHNRRVRVPRSGRRTNAYSN